MYLSDYIPAQSLAHHSRLSEAAGGMVQVERRAAVSYKHILYSQSLEQPGLSRRRNGVKMILPGNLVHGSFLKFLKIYVAINIPVFTLASIHFFVCLLLLLHSFQSTKILSNKTVFARENAC